MNDYYASIDKFKTIIWKFRVTFIVIWFFIEVEFFMFSFM